MNTPNSANVPGSHSGLPKKWPDFGESIDSYRERIYNLHQERVRQNKNKFGEKLILEYGEWKEIFGSEVDANWELNKDKKSPKTILPKERTPKEPAPKVASTGLTKTQIVIGLVGLVAFGVLSIIFPSEDETKVKENKQQEVITMPNAIGMNYGDFKDKETKFLDKFYADTVDLIESRSIWDNYNWVVVAQIPPAGSKLIPDDRICLGVVKVEESNLDHKRLHCWQEVTDFESTTGYSYDMVLKDLLKVTLPKPELKGFFLKATVLIEMKDWSTVTLTYCSYEAVGTNGSITTNLELDPGASGTAFGDGGESFNTGLFKDWTGSYTYQIRQMWKSFGSGCFSF